MSNYFCIKKWILTYPTYISERKNDVKMSNTLIRSETHYSGTGAVTF